MLGAMLRIVSSTLQCGNRSARKAQHIHMQALEDVGGRTTPIVNESEEQVG